MSQITERKIATSEVETSESNQSIQGILTVHDRDDESKPKTLRLCTEQERDYILSFKHISIESYLTLLGQTVVARGNFKVAGGFNIFVTTKLERIEPLKPIGARLF